MPVAVTVTGLEDAAKDVVAQIEQKLAEFNLKLLPIIKDRSPMGPSKGKDDGIKRMWRVISPRMKSGVIIAGVSNELPYVDRINKEQLRHVPGMRGKPVWSTSFGKEYGGDDGRLGQTNSRQYGRGYYRAVRNKRGGKSETYATHFIEDSLNAVGAKVLAVEQEGEDTVYYIDLNLEV